MLPEAQVALVKDIAASAIENYDIGASGTVPELIILPPDMAGKTELAVDAGHCRICGGSLLGAAWTDTNGVVECLQCNSPYGRKTPGGENDLLIDLRHLDAVRAWWTTHHKLIPHGYSFAGSSRRRVSREEAATFMDFFTNYLAKEGKAQCQT
jgi:hypothetical protein